ncbi:MAG: chromosomal replication initiator protein DnaA [Bacteroidota bacterium]|nr:chromosomal replication initiator protein DnaA [Bacteroidota bacterium]
MENFSSDKITLDTIGSGENIVSQLPNAIAENIWGECLQIFRGRVNSQSYKAWFEPIIPIQFENGNFTIQIPSQFFQDWLEEHHYSLLIEAITHVVGTNVELSYIVKPEERESIPYSQDDHFSVQVSTQTDGLAENRNANTGQPKSELTPRNTQRTISHFLNPRYTFENYIKGESNQFAQAAALAVANSPGGTSFNPLVIYGGVGLGKTHLVHAIGNRVIQSGKSKKILYVSSEKFTVDFVESIQKDSVSDFSNHYRSLDILIVDDIQFFAGKEKTQDVFFHTFNTLYQSGKQIILSSDKPPKDLKGLNERLISRFQWGLTADIQPPDLETRIAILQKKCSDSRIELSHNIVEFIASNVTTNIRELEGCLISLLARASLEHRDITLQLAQDVVQSVIGNVRPYVTIQEIQSTVSEYLKVPEDLLRAKTRKQEIAIARQIAMYLAKVLTSSSLKTIGLHFGGRDHSTVIHAYQTVEDLISTDPKFKSIVKDLRTKLERAV